MADDGETTQDALRETSELLEPGLAEENADDSGSTPAEDADSANGGPAQFYIGDGEDAVLFGCARSPPLQPTIDMGLPPRCPPSPVGLESACSAGTSVDRRSWEDAADSASHIAAVAQDDSAPSLDADHVEESVDSTEVAEATAAVASVAAESVSSADDDPGLSSGDTSMTAVAIANAAAQRSRVRGVLEASATDTSTATAAVTAPAAAADAAATNDEDVGFSLAATPPVATVSSSPATPPAEVRASIAPADLVKLAAAMAAAGSEAAAPKALGGVPGHTPPTMSSSSSRGELFGLANSPMGHTGSASFPPSISRSAAPGMLAGRLIPPVPNGSRPWRKVDKVGRFRIRALGAQSPGEEEAADCDSFTVSDSASVFSERQETFASSTANFQDVCTLLENKQKEIGGLFDRMRSQIFQVVVGQNVPCGLGGVASAAASNRSSPGRGTMSLRAASSTSSLLGGSQPEEPRGPPVMLTPTLTSSVGSASASARTAGSLRPVPTSRASEVSSASSAGAPQYPRPALPPMHATLTASIPPFSGQPPLCPEVSSASSAGAASYPPRPAPLPMQGTMPASMQPQCGQTPNNNEALELWEAMGGSIQRAMTRHWQLETENRRLKEQLFAKQEMLQSLQIGLQAVAAAFASTSATSASTTSATAGTDSVGAPTAAGTSPIDGASDTAQVASSSGSTVNVTTDAAMVATLAATEFPRNGSESHPSASPKAATDVVSTCELPFEGPVVPAGSGAEVAIEAVPIIAGPAATASAKAEGPQAASTATRTATPSVSSSRPAKDLPQLSDYAENTNTLAQSVSEPSAQPAAAQCLVCSQNNSPRSLPSAEALKVNATPTSTSSRSPRRDSLEFADGAEVPRAIAASRSAPPATTVTSQPTSAACTPVTSPRPPATVLAEDASTSAKLSPGSSLVALSFSKQPQDSSHDADGLEASSTVAASSSEPPAATATAQPADRSSIMSPRSPQATGTTAMPTVASSTSLSSSTAGAFSPAPEHSPSLADDVEAPETMTASPAAATATQSTTQPTFAARSPVVSPRPPATVPLENTSTNTESPLVSSVAASVSDSPAATPTIQPVEFSPTTLPLFPEALEARAVSAVISSSSLSSSTTMSFSPSSQDLAQLADVAEVSEPPTATATAQPAPCSPIASPRSPEVVGGAMSTSTSSSTDGPFSPTLRDSPDFAEDAGDPQMMTASISAQPATTATTQPTSAACSPVASPRQLATVSAGDTSTCADLPAASSSVALSLSQLPQDSSQNADDGEGPNSVSEPPATTPSVQPAACSPLASPLPSTEVEVVATSTVSSSPSHSSSAAMSFSSPPQTSPCLADDIQVPKTVTASLSALPARTATNHPTSASSSPVGSPRWAEALPAGQSVVCSPIASPRGAAALDTQLAKDSLQLAECVEGPRIVAASATNFPSGPPTAQPMVACSPKASPRPQEAVEAGSTSIGTPPPLLSSATVVPVASSPRGSPHLAGDVEGSRTVTASPLSPPAEQAAEGRAMSTCTSSSSISFSSIVSFSTPAKDSTHDAEGPNAANSSAPSPFAAPAVQAETESAGGARSMGADAFGSAMRNDGPTPRQRSSSVGSEGFQELHGGGLRRRVRK
eukprot:TRINITY_DN7567_c0_g1_i1.p1 TRINITY_DN7567_c0_g1~~TRINITY_DN7567_c0_g1_i1.p1  ORF type:complete len:1610 (-),score=272.20 TRINITY_DN7567_c0_g1_i1:267-5096(-)